MSLMDKLKSLFGGGAQEEPHHDHGHDHAGHDHSHDHAHEHDAVPAEPVAPLDPLGTTMPDPAPQDEHEHGH